MIVSVAIKPHGHPISIYCSIATCSENKKSKVRRDFIVSETSPAAATTQVDQWIILSGQGRPGQGALLHNNQGETVRVRAGPGPSAAPSLNLETFCEERIPASAQSNACRSRIRGRWGADVR